MAVDPIEDHIFWIGMQFIKAKKEERNHSSQNCQIRGPSAADLSSAK